MMDLITGLLLLVIGFGFGHLSGWLKAHRMIAKECECLGGFFVGEQVYECTKVDKLGPQTTDEGVTVKSTATP